MATAAQARVTGISFWAKMSIGISGFIVFGFAQFALRGFVPYMQVPVIFHLHGVVMLAWLGLMCAQSLLAGRGAGLEIHRALGWVSVVMAPSIVVLASLTCLAALRTHLFPPFFTPAYFLALIHVDIAIFAVLVAIAIVRRGETQWHKRLMLGSAVLLMDPALGRVLPMPFIMPWGEWLAMAIELGVVFLIVRHDRKALGRIHPATLAVILAVVLSHVVVELLAITPWWIAFAAPFAA